MEKFIKKILAAATALGCVGATPAMAAEIRETLHEAGAFIEPAVTYETGDAKANLPVLGSSNGEVTGYGLALRAGAHIFESVLLGVDGRYSFPNVRDDRTDLDANGTAYNWGPVVGLQMPNIGLRVWGGYIVDGSIDPKGEKVNVKFNGAEGYRVGAGFKVYDVSLNVEYANIRYANAILQNGGIVPSFASGANFGSVDYRNQSYTASVSFPFAL